MLLPGSSLDHPIDAFPLHPVCCLFSSILIPSCLHLLGFLDRSCFTGWGSQPHTYPRLVGQVSIFISPGDRMVQLYPWTLGIHFSCLLWHTCTTRGYSCSQPPHGKCCLYSTELLFWWTSSLYMCVCVCFDIHTYVHKYIHTYVLTYVHTYIHTHVGESIENLKYFLSCNLLNTKGTQWLYFST